MSEGSVVQLKEEENTLKNSETADEKVSPNIVNTERLENVSEKASDVISVTVDSIDRVGTEKTTFQNVHSPENDIPLDDSITPTTTDELKTQKTLDTPIDSEKPQEETNQTTTDLKATSILKEEEEDENNAATTSAERAINETEDATSSATSLKDECKVKKAESKQDSNDKYAEHVTYTEDGTAIYTDPKTKHQYKWCSKENKWLTKDTTTATTNPYENEHYKWCSVTQKWLPKQTQVTETEHYKWDAEKNEWVAKVEAIKTTEQTKPTTEIVHSIDENGERTYTDKDGMIFFWDEKNNAWFPKIDEDFMARYQMNYGFIDNTSESEKEKEKRALEAVQQKEKELAQMVEEAKANEEASQEAGGKLGTKRKTPQEPPKWFEIDPDHNTKVYVSNLPVDITLDEFVELMSKCGMIMRDPQTQKYKLKLYTEADGQIKGDGLCDYIKVESVDLALNILDEYDLRGHKIRVQRAQFQMRGEYNPALKPKRKKKDKEKLAKIKEKLFDWRPEKMRGERLKHEKTVILKNLFQPELFEKEVQLILDYQNDLREECGKCGTVRKVVIYDRHSEGVAQVNMASPEEADLVIQMMHGRYFGKRQLTAEHWDGKTKYKIEETEEEIQKRLNKWDQYLETEEQKKFDTKQVESKTENTLDSLTDALMQPPTQTLVKDEDKQMLDEAEKSNVPETGDTQQTENVESTDGNSTKIETDK